MLVLRIIELPNKSQGNIFVKRVYNFENVEEDTTPRKAINFNLDVVLI